MEKDKFRFADKGEQIKKINRFLVIGVLVFNIIIAGIVLGSYLSQFRSLQYLLALVAVMALGSGISIVMFKKAPDSAKIRLVIFVELMIVSLMITAVYENDYMRFMPIIPFIGCMLFYDVKFSMMGAVYISVMNWIVILGRIYVLHEFTGSDVINKLTSCLVITVMMFIVLYTTLVGKRFNEDSLNRVRTDADKQNTMIQDVLQIV